MDSYFTISKPSQSQLREKMSRFISFAIPVASAEEAKAEIARKQNEYHDARHVCWAYMIGPERKQFLSSDNGEPSGTAGKPILGQINSFNLTDIVVIVVRYFGGIKLGTSGLIAAYREAARLALSEAEIIEKHQTSRYSFTFPYLSMNEVMRIAKMPQVRVISQQFDNSCSMTIECNLADSPMVESRLSSVSGLTLPPR
ncbi:MAG: YigZ family protein [Bacteroidales bacterium]|nr:YigZ family protein [Bacteroidales bacterium]